MEQFQVRLFQFVLMTNHFHLVFETPEGNCSRFMQSLSTAYTVYYNLRHGRHGHVLGLRYKAKVVEGDERRCVSRRCSPLRAVAARVLLCHGGQTQREAAFVLGMGTGGAVSSVSSQTAGLILF